MKLSVVIPCLNGMPYLEKALSSILENAKGLEVEIVFQDGGSTDGSVELAERMLGREAIRVEKDECHEDAVNRGWHRCTGDVMAWLNADDYYVSGTFQKILNVFESNPQARWCFGDFQMVDGEGRPIRRIHQCYKSFLIRHYSYPLLLVENMIPQMSVFIRKELWQETGDLMLHNWAFDYDYWIRLARKSRPAILPEVLSCFRWHPASKTGRDPRRLFREELEVCRRHTTNPFLRGIHGLFCLRNTYLYHRITW